MTGGLEQMTVVTVCPVCKKEFRESCLEHMRPSQSLTCSITGARDDAGSSISTAQQTGLSHDLVKSSGLKDTGSTEVTEESVVMQLPLILDAEDYDDESVESEPAGLDTDGAAFECQELGQDWQSRVLTYGFAWGAAYRCGHCGKIFSRPELFYSHMQSLNTATANPHAASAPEPKPVAKQVPKPATKPAPKPAAMWVSKPLASASPEPEPTETGAHECVLCQKRFFYNWELQRHRRVHSRFCPDKPYRCQLCGRRFSREIDVRLHDRSHAILKPMECKHCGKIFARRRNFIRHLRVHS